MTLIVVLELDEADFCVPEDDLPDESMLPPAARPDAAARATSIEPTSMQQRNSFGGNAGALRPPQTPQAAQRPTAPQNGPSAAPQRQALQQAGNNNNQAPAAGANSTLNPPETVAFFSAKALSQLPEGDPNPAALPGMAKQLFNPKAESPSIRRTPGIDHTSSRPLARSGQHVAPSASQSTAASGPAPAAALAGNSGNFTPVRPGAITRASGGVVNNSVDQARRIGAPGGGGSPLANRGSYKPPSMKRAPLTELPANGGPTAVVGAANDAQGDAKRQKTA